MNDLLKQLLNGNNAPTDGSVSFTSSDHMRFQDGKAVSGHNHGAIRKLVVEKNIEDLNGYTVTIYNLSDTHPFWQDNIQMAPKRMRIINVSDNIVELRGYGYDERALAMGVPLEDASFEDYGVVLKIENDEIVRAQLNMFDRNISIVYLK